MRPLIKIPVLISWAAVAATAMADPQYQIFDIGVVQVGDTASQGFGVSPGGIAVGRSFRSGGAQAFTWTQGGGLVGLPNLAGRSFAVSNDANDSGAVVGTAATTAFGSGRLPVIWQSGAVSQLPLPAGETLGDANGVNVLGVAVGSVDGGSTQQAVIYDGGTATVITQMTPNGCVFVTAFGINNSGRIVGFGIDPNNAARNVGIVYDMGSPAAFEVGALPGANGALAFGVGNGGHVVGSSMMNQGSGMPFIWSQANGIVAIPLATGTSQGSARAVNSAGWVVGQDSSAFSIPFLWDGTTTYRLADLLPPGCGWDLSMNTSSSALGISDNGVIVGTGVHNGDTHAYAMVPVTGTPTPSPTPTATPSPTPCGLIIAFRENFDGITAPALPADWETGFTPGAANCTPTGTCALGTKWATSTTAPDTAPNCAFHDAPGCVIDSTLDTPCFLSGPTNGTFLFFRHSYNLESGKDGAVLEISINGGPFVDFVAAGGGNPQYNGTISSGSLSPIAGRSAWTGNSGGYVTASAQMPVSAANQDVRLRFRLATDCSGAGTGWRVDAISVEDNIGCQPPTPTPSPTASPTLTPDVQATHFEVIAPSMVATFQPFNFTVRALDPFNNTATGYTGTIHFTSTSQGSLPPNSTLTNGFGTFSASLNTLGNQTITATDTLNASITGTSNTISVISDIVTPPPSATPTPPTTPTPFPCAIIKLRENFDAATAPALPAGWTSSFTPGPASCSPGGTCALGTNWATSTAGPFSPPNSAFHDAPGCVTDSTLDTPSFVSFQGLMLEFQHHYDLANGLDGAVLEISINGGPFTDFVGAGGTIAPGQGYNGTISAAFQSPIAGRAAWTGNSGGYVTTWATLPPAASDQQVRLRFRVATDCSGSSTGWHLDNVSVLFLIPCPTPTPTPSTPTPSPTLTPTPTPTPSSTPAAQPLNLSTRLRVQTGDNAGIAGFIITGTVPKNLLFRGIGPSLTAFGVAGALGNPTLDLRRPDGTRIRANNDWQEDPVQAAAIQATGLAPQNNLEAAIVETLDPGSYTVILRGMGMTTGVGLVEVYDLNQGVDSKLANLSTRAFVDTGDSIVIAGFTLGGSNGNDRAVVRGIGPSLTAFGVANALADPTLELRDSNGALLAANNNWQDDPAQAAELTAAGLAPLNPLESGIAITLSPGPYTALLAGRNNGTGVGVVEVYDRGAPP